MTNELKAAQALEMNPYDRLEVFDKADIAESRAKEGRGPTHTDGVDHGENTKFRPRRLDRQYKTDSVDQEWVAGTPPQDHMRLLIT